MNEKTNDNALKEYSLKTLQEYLKANIPLYPCNQNGAPLVKTYDEAHNEINTIKDINGLLYWMQRGAARYSFYPKNHRFVVIDLDNSDAHANTINGINAFIEFTKTLELTEKNKMILKDFPHNFPCYVETPHTGIHLYFNAAYIPDHWRPDANVFNKKNIEIKTNTQATAGGSIRDGRPYILHGRLKDAPKMTTDLINAFSKYHPAPIEIPQTFMNQDAGNAWTKTPQGIIDKAIEKHGHEGAHFIAMWAAIYFRDAGYPMETAIAAISATPHHQNRRDKQNTITTIQNIFKNPK